MLRKLLRSLAGHGNNEVWYDDRYYIDYFLFMQWFFFRQDCILSLLGMSDILKQTMTSDHGR
jgi:hypothetical protein